MKFLRVTQILNSTTQEPALINPATISRVGVRSQRQGTPTLPATLEITFATDSPATIVILAVDFEGKDLHPNSVANADHSLLLEMFQSLLK